MKNSFRAFTVLPLVLAMNAAFAADQAAQDQDTQAVALNPVVVSASGYEQDTREAPASITVIPSEQLMTKAVADLGQAVADVPGVDTTTTKMGNSLISIRGFDPAYTLMMVDGRRLNTSDGMVVVGFDPNATIMPPPGAIERIEVLRGPASTAWGSDAVGGVVNVITKKHVDKFTGSIQIDRSQFFSNDFGDRTGVGLYLGVPLKENVATLILRGRYQKRQASDLHDPSGQYAGHSPSEGYNGNIGARLNLTVNPNNDLWIDGDFTRFQGGTMMTSPWAYKVKRDWNKYNLAFGHSTKTNIGQWDSYFQWNSLSVIKSVHGEPTANLNKLPAPSEYGSWKDPLTNSTTYTLSTKLVSPLDFGKYGAMTLSSGLEADYETYKDNSSNASSSYLIPPTATPTPVIPDDGTLRGKKIHQTTLAGFLEGEYFINDYWTGTLGGRLHWSDMFGGHFAPRGYLVFKPYEFISFKGGVAAGYKTPAIKKLYDGIYYNGTNNYYVGDSNLKPEESWNYELSTTLQWPQLGSLTLGAFYTDFKNKIDDRVISSWPSGSSTGYLYKAVNHGKVTVKGVEALLQTASFHGFKLTGGYTLTDAEIKDGADEGKRPNDIPRHSLTARVDYANGPFGAYVKSTSKFDAVDPDNDHKYKNYTVVDIGATYVYNKHHHFSVALNNVFDTGIDFWSTETKRGPNTVITWNNDYRDYLDGRNLWLSYAYTF